MVIERDEAMMADWLSWYLLIWTDISIRDPTICLKYWFVGFVTPKAYATAVNSQHTSAHP